MVDSDVLWTAVSKGNNIVTIGFGSEDEFHYEGGDVAALQSQKQSILASIVDSEMSMGVLSADDVFLDEDDTFTHFDVFIRNKETLDAVLAMDNIRYVEPSDYSYFGPDPTEDPQAFFSGSGCDTDSDNINNADFNLVNNARIPWNFYNHNIDHAWSLTSGAGTTVGVIDTGISASQNNFSTQFNSGMSSGRSIQKYGDYVSSWWPWASPDGPNDRCGHGTSMAAAIAAPRNSEGVPTGVAYNANLITVRGTSDVVLDGYNEQKGTANAIKRLANKSQLKVMSMSIGHIWSVGRITDAINYAYYSKGKMIIAAGGTSTSFTNWYGVIFPAWLNETVAVTGVTDRSSYEECDTCHKGSAIDFTIIMQRDSNSNRNSVCLGFSGNTSDYIGGSSVATATTAGIAALVWSRHPSWSRAQVYNRLKQSADLYPSKSGSYGYGNIDAWQAVQ